MNHESFIYTTNAWILSALLFLLMMGFIYLGRKLGFRRMLSQKDPDAPATGILMSSMLGLMAFLLAFTFNMSSNRFDGRKKNIVDEANAIGTATLRSDLYSPEERLLFRKDFQQYVETRIHFYEVGKNIPEMQKAEALSEEIGKRIWNRAVNLSQKKDNYLPSLVMINALNEMIDLRTTRMVGERSRVPDSIVWMLFILLMACAFYIGYLSAGKGYFDWFLAIGFCLLASVVLLITLDLDRPRRGFITLKHSQSAMVELRKLFE